LQAQLLDTRKACVTGTSFIGWQLGSRPPVLNWMYVYQSLS
jgi:hypothetical protein